MQRSISLLTSSPMPCSQCVVWANTQTFSNTCFIVWVDDRLPIAELFLKKLAAALVKHIMSTKWHGHGSK
jgi:hypothetical protein